MPRTIIYANLLPFLAMFSMFLFKKINPLFDRNQDRLFTIAANIIMFMLVVISIDYTISLTAPSYEVAVRSVTSFLNFGLCSVVPLIMICIFVNKKISYWLFMPAIINFVISGLSIFFGLVFVFGPDGSYNRGPLFMLPFMIVIFYLIILTVLSIKERQKRPQETIMIIGVILSSSLAMYLEVYEHFYFQTWDYAAVCLLLYYLLLNINRSKLDQLTNINNRAMYVKHTESINGYRPCLIAMIDINGFKAINDTKGHAYGDKVLIQFVEITNSFMNSKNKLYRIGGDEFAIISEDSSIESFKQRIEDCFKKLSEVDIYCAVGYVAYDPQDDLEKAIQEADMKMYENKRNFYSTND